MLCNKTLALFLLIILIGQGSLELKAQWFTNATADLGVVDPLSISSVYGAGITVIDLDRDGWDDIVVPRFNQPTVWYRNTGSGFERSEIIPANGDMKCVIFGDMDNDGDYDALIISRTHQLRVLRNNGQQVFQGYPMGPIWLSGSNGYGGSWGDVNGDGLLDAYTNSYQGVPNALFLNSESGQFTNVASAVGVANGAPTLNFAFQSSLIDLDFDGDIDIHVANDRSPIDGLFIQQENFTFQDVAPQSGLHVHFDSMCSSFCDFDNDGDYDLYVSNTASGNGLFENQGDFEFVNIAEDRGVAVWKYCWGSLWVDIDNDSWEDLYVNVAYSGANNTNEAFRNVHGYFHPISDFADVHPDYSTLSAAKGDFNRDGYYDIVVYGFDRPPQVFINNGGNNNWINVTLQGTVSNRDAVGSWFEYYLGSRRIIRHTSAGDNYLSQNSAHYILAMGTEVFVDTLIVHWPSGLVDKYFHIPARQYLYLIEGQTTSGAWASSAGQVICPGETVLLTVEHAVDIYWSDGDSSLVRLINSPGAYSAWWLDTLGFIRWIAPIVVSDANLPDVIMATIAPLCAGGQDGQFILLNDSDYSFMIWDSNQTGFEVNNLAPGNYPVTAVTHDGCEVHFSAVIPESVPTDLQFVTTDVSCYGSQDGTVDGIVFNTDEEPAEFVITDDMGNQADPGALSAGNYLLQATDSNGCVVEAEFTVAEPEALTLSVEFNELLGYSCTVSGGSAPHQISWSSGAIGVWSGWLDPGTVWVEVYDANGCMELLEFEASATDGMDKLSFEDLLVTSQRVCILDIRISEIRVYDSMGRLLAGSRYPCLNWEWLPAGVYWIVQLHDGAVVGSGAWFKP